MLKASGAMISSHELATSTDPVLPMTGPAAPPWVIAALGAAIVAAGIGYFVVRARRARPRR
jgi:LPXTG-motif cell wall-anchored protein